MRRQDIAGAQQNLQSGKKVDPALGCTELSELFELVQCGTNTAESFLPLKLVEIVYTCSHSQEQAYADHRVLSHNPQNLPMHERYVKPGVLWKWAQPPFIDHLLKLESSELYTWGHLISTNATK